MDGWRLRRLDLVDRTAALLRSGPGRLVVPRLPAVDRGPRAPRDGRSARVPDVPSAPVDEYRASLYTAGELYDGVRERGLPGDSRRRVATPGRSGSTATPPTSWSGRCTTPPSSRRSMPTSRRPRAPIVGVMGGHGIARGTRRLSRRGARWVGGWPAPASSSRPEVGPGRWRRPTSAPTSSSARGAGRRRGARRCWRRCRRSSHRSATGRVAVLRGAATVARRRRRARRADVVLRPRAAERVRRRRSPSSSRTRCARRRCSTGATAAWCSCPAPPAPCRRSSRTRARTTTRRPSWWRRWCSSGAEHWTETVPAWPLLSALARARGFGHARRPRRRRRRGGCVRRGACVTWHRKRP